MLAVLMLAGGLAPSAQAQDDVMRQAMEGYRNLNSLTAKVTRTVHNDMVANDKVTRGTFYFKKPARMCVSTNGGKDMLLTDGESFTIVQDGRPTTATGRGNSSLTPLVNAIKGIASGNSDVDLSDVADVDMERQGDKLIMTIAPIVRNATERRKMLFQSYVITIDQKAGQLRSIRLNGKGSNYEQYDFSDFQFDAPVSDSVFEVR